MPEVISLSKYFFGPLLRIEEYDQRNLLDLDLISICNVCGHGPYYLQLRFIRHILKNHRQSQKFYETAKEYKTVNLSPLIKAANIQSTDIVLDLACGPGLITTECAKQNPKKVYGMDNTKEMLEIAKKHALDNDVAGRIEFIEGNV